MARARKKNSVSFDALTVEGGLITSAMLASVTAREAGHQKEEDYNIPKGLTLRDEIARYFRIGQALYRELTASQAPSEAATIHFTEALLRDAFGFSDIKRVGQKTINDQLYAVTLEALEGRVPVVVVPPADDLDRVSAGLPTDGRKRSASSAIQDWLNANEDALWGLCCNGEKIRLARDNASFTRPAYIEANLRQIFEAENFADFTTLWLLIHSSRFGVKASVVSDCALERWRETGSKEGLAARDRLRDGVESALLALGNGFLAHPQNNDLRARLEKGELPLPDYFSQLLRLVYRLIFLLVAEDRELLHLPSASTQVRKLYADGYSLSCLRSHCTRRSAWDRYHDRWEGLNITFAALVNGEPRLGLPALSGLFSVGVIPDLEIAHLSNKALMEAVYRLAWLKEPSGLMSVNWRDMETEELGSVYESLLELTPRLTDHGDTFSFAEGAETKGNTRKTTGSYYTPDSLVQALLDSSLDPVLDRVVAEADDPAKALLTVTVIDPACGSGHFLLAAARRIASRVARTRAGGVASAEDYRHALRDVARNCIYGVDRNPMAVELTKVALWIETVEPGKPLGFLDANIRCGDSLLGVFDLKSLHHGIPDEAYKALMGDDKETSKYFEKVNKADKGGQGSFDFLSGGGGLPAPPPLASTVRNIRSLPEDSVKDIIEKKSVFEASKSDPRLWTWRVAADLFIAAFLVPKIGGLPANKNIVTIPTTSHIWQQISGKQPYGPLITRARDLAIKARAFHWPLEFPDIMANGGFDVVLGNPPWEKANMKYEEFFQQYEPSILEAKNDNEREKEIENLQTTNPKVYTLYRELSIDVEKKINYLKNSGFLPLTSNGFINYYSSFAELMLKLLRDNARAGVILQSGIATDKTNEDYFSYIVSKNYLCSLFDFVNSEKIFNIHASFKFSLITLSKDGKQSSPLFAFNLTNPANIGSHCYRLSYEDIRRVNPNTFTCPVFYTSDDADLVKRVYKKSGLFFSSEGKSFCEAIGIHRMFNATTDQKLFLILQDDFIQMKENFLPIYEAKLIWHYDHRYSTFEGCSKQDIKNGNAEYITEQQKKDVHKDGLSRWIVHTKEPEDFNKKYACRHDWYLAIRMVARSSDERTLVASIIPKSGSVNSLNLVTGIDAPQSACLLANLNSIVMDYVTRTKVNSANLNQWIIEQLPVISFSEYSQEDIRFIVSRVLELTYTSVSMFSFAKDQGYNGKPFVWDEKRRALLRSELDAWYARAYGLTRDELRYILEPADMRGPDYPSETFRVLKDKEIKEFGEYRTRRLVLEAWDRLMNGELAAA